MISESGLGDWVGRIQAACAFEASSVLELAGLIWQARESLRPHRGSWSALWKTEKMPFGKRPAEKYFAVGKGFDGLIANDRSHLPAAFNTLYCLSDLGHEAIADLISQGCIHPGLKLKEAQALVAGFPSESQPVDSRSKLQNRLKGFTRFVRTDLETWSKEERKMVTEELAALAAEIRKASDKMAAAQKTTEARGASANQTQPVRQIL